MEVSSQLSITGVGFWAPSESGPGWNRRSTGSSEVEQLAFLFR